MIKKLPVFCLCGFLLLSPLTSFSVENLVVSVPGPRNISYLPIDLISKLGFDAEEGINLKLLHVGGGAVALNNLMTRNADFAVAGMPAVMSLRANGGDVITVAAVNDAPLFVLMVRSALKGKVKRIADLQGMVIGVNTSTKNSKTTSQQLAEVLLQSAGVSIDQVRIVPAGQNWAEQSSLMISGAADAIVGDEPFASRLLAEKKVFFLAHLAQPETVKQIVGVNFLHAAVSTRNDLLSDNPAKVEKMVKILRKTLQWIAIHKPEEVVDKLGISDPQEREGLLLALKKYPNVYSRDGQLSTLQLQETEKFFHNSNADNPAVQAIRIESMIESKWAGRSR
jgi:NitT/TauT family transport system substrate-binding protein